MPMINPFTTDGFSLVALTDAINVIPNMYGKTNELGLFTEKGVRTRTVIVDEKDGVLNLLPTRPVGAPGTEAIKGRRKVRSFVIPHIPHEDGILPEETQGLRAFGSENELEALETLVAERLETARRKHDITLENLRMGALRGQILDADGSVIYDLFSEFGLTQNLVNFQFSSNAFDVKTAVLNVKRYMELHLLGEVMREVHCLCAPDWFDAFTRHPDVITAFQFFQHTDLPNQTLDSDNRRNFRYGGVTFEEYLGHASDGDGVDHVFVPESSAIFFPLGTMTTFRTWFAPADFNETVNTVGLPIYAKLEPRKFNRGMDLHTQSNPLPMCLRPALLTKATMS